MVYDVGATSRTGSASEFISVVTPAYNSSHTVSRAIESVLSQDDTTPYIVVDDCSSADHVYHLESYKSLTYLRNAVNLGGASTRNVGLELVETPYVLFLDADDYILPGTIEELMRIATSGSPDVVFFPWYKQNQVGATFGPFNNGATDPIEMFFKWLSGRFVPPCAFVWRTEFLRSIGSWGEGLRYDDDTELALRSMLFRPKIALAEQGGGVYIKGVNPDAVSNASVSVAIEAQSQIMQHLALQVERHIEDIDLRKRMLKALGSFLFVTIRLAYAQQLDSKADAALSISRSLGFHGFVGSTQYRFLASLIGPKYAEYLFVYLKSVTGTKTNG